MKPVAVRADYAAIEGEVTRVSSLQMQKIVAPNATDLKQYGLDKPDVHRDGIDRQRARDAPRRQEGRRRPVREGRLAAARSSPSKKRITQDFAKDLNDFRRKDMFDARSFTTNRIELHRGAETLAFDKSKAADGKDVWKNAAGKTIDTRRSRTCSPSCRTCARRTFEPTQNASLKMPALTVTVRFDENKMETVTFGRRRHRRLRQARRRTGLGQGRCDALRRDDEDA